MTKPDGPLDLETLLGEARGEIDAIDTRILDLLAERRKVVEKVVEVKKSHGLPVYHPAREENLLSKRREEAVRLGLGPDMVEDLFRTIMRGSRISQNESMRGKSVAPGASVLFVGGQGAMAQSLSPWFVEAGYEVRILDVDDWDRVETLCRGLNLAILAVPIDATPSAAKRLSPHLPPDCVLADITSVKARPLKAMLDSFSGPVVGLHPMFGPGTSTLDKQIVVVTEGREPEKCRWVVDQLATWGAVIVKADAGEHDRAMDVVQGLRHFATFAFGQFLYHSKVDLATTLEFSSPIYRLELDMVGRLFAQDPGLYSKIIFSTPERIKLLREYIASLSENVRMLEEWDEEAFLAEFRRIAEWFGPFSDQAIRESGYLIDKMIERF